MKGFCCRPIVHLFALSTLLFHVPTAHAAKQTVKSIPVKEGDEIFNLTSESGKNFVCMKSGQVISAGKLSSDSKNFTAFDKEYKTKIAAYKVKLKAAKLKKKKKAIAKFNKLIASAKAELAAMKSSCSSAFNCTVESQGQEFNVKENAEFEFDLTATTTCDREIHYTVTSLPAKGVLQEITGTRFKYSAGFGAGSANLSFKACVPSFSKCSESQVTFNMNAGEKVGRADKLGAYRNSITRAEAKHLIKKIAMNDKFILTDDLKIGDLYNLEAIINKLIDPNYTVPDLKPQLEMLRDHQKFCHPQDANCNNTFSTYKGTRDINGTPVFPLAQTFNTSSQQIAALDKIFVNYMKGWDTGFPWLTYGGVASASIPLYRARYLSPTAGLMTNIWQGHFGTAIHNLSYYSEFYTRDYIELIYNNSLGNFKQMMLGTTPTSCLNGVGKGILCDSASNFWLSNIFNTYRNPNQNFARELLEIYLLGVNDAYTGNPNYNQNDVEAATAFVSGYKEEWYTSVRGYPQANLPVDRKRVVFDQALHDFKEFTAFQFTPYEIKGTFTANQFVEHVIDKHPGTSRNIAGKLFRMLAYTDPTETLVQELADYFKSNNFDIAALIHKIASSEAMFSEKAVQPKCIKEPFRVFIEPFRNLKLPFFGDSMFWSPATHNIYFNYNFALEFYEALRQSGEMPLLYETPFTHDYCGRNPQAFGQRWTFAPYLMNRVKMMIKLMSRQGWISQVTFPFRDIAKQILAPNEQIFALTPARLIAFFNDVYGVELSPEEYEVINRYITSRLDAANVKEVTLGWNAGDSKLLEEKMAGLIVIYSSISQSNVL